jgi:YVTN family beta-propeller protein
MIKMDKTQRLFRQLGSILALGCLTLVAGANATAGQTAEPATAGVAPDAATAQDSYDRLTRQGLTIDFAARPVRGSFEEDRDLLELDYAHVSFTITDASGQPVEGLVPGAWVDLVETAGGGSTDALSCRDRVGLYLRSSTGTQPLIDMNSYFILVMNEDATISVVDPSVLIAGVGDMFFPQIILPRPGADWVQTADQNRIFVTMPRAGTLGVIETETFKLINQVKTGTEPLRVALQPDERYVWVGNNAKGKVGGVTVIDAESLAVAAELTTGKGHHEIAFSDDNRVALVTNRADGTATAIDIRTLEKIKDIAVGKTPLAAAYSSLSKSFFVADGAAGKVHVIDGATLDTVTRIQAKAGIGPMRISGDGRWLLVTNSANDLVHVIDTSANAIAHDIPIAGRPFQISLTRAFAYIRALDSDRVSMINLAEIGKTGLPPVVAFPLGAAPPGKASSLSIADGIVEAAGEAGVVAVDPVAGSLYYYMEGMNAPMGSFRSYGHNPRAVLVTDRSLAENQAGIYSSRIQLPKAGTYEVAFALDAPPILHCFRFAAEQNPALKSDLKALEIEYLLAERIVPVGKPALVRFRLVDPASEQPRTGLSDVRVLYYRSPGVGRRDVPAKEVGNGIYEAELAISARGTYFVYVSSTSSRMPAGELRYLTLRAVAAGDGAARPMATPAALE